MITFDIAHVPFSRCGSYLAISRLPENPTRAAGVYLRTLHGDAPHREICRIELFVDDKAVDFRVEASPSVLRLQAAHGFVEICFADRDTLYVRGKHLGLRLIFANGEYDQAIARDGGWQINSFSNRITCALFSLRGQINMDAPPGIARSQHVIAQMYCDESGKFESRLSECRDVWPHHATLAVGSFDAQRRLVETEFSEWLRRAPQVPKPYRATRELAAYVQWSAVVAPQGLLSRPAMLMSKNWLTAVWSWDHCFNALALSYGDREMAWHQFMLPFDYQRDFGVLPDCVNDTQHIWNFCKPPVHGWALQWLLQRNAVSVEQLQQIYAPLSRWTEWWLRERDDNRNGLAQYNHGNDSGWDNSTLFDGGMPIDAPDLAAFLVVQMQVLATIAHTLNKSRAAHRWQLRADELLQTLLTMLWREDHFIALRGETAVSSDTLLLLMPIVLKKKLPKAMRESLIDGLRQHFLTEYGLASEAPTSTRYEADGYWRGPIWAPATLMIVDALAAIGERRLAQTLAQRFCTLVVCGGVAENFDALTGAPLRDRAHTWTASVFLILAHDYLR